jgi:hypothetical protein
MLSDTEFLEYLYEVRRRHPEIIVPDLIRLYEARVQQARIDEEVGKRALRGKKFIQTK